MANQNLSEFTEKTFVADADWTFVWDTAGLISKKVSRNNWLNSGTLATSAPVTISQTWNALAVAFTAFKVNATSTNSANASLLADFQVGGTSKFSVDKFGIVTAAGSFRQTPTGAGISVSANGASLGLYSNNSEIGYCNGTTFILNSAVTFGWSATSASSGSYDTVLVRDGAANTLALRNGAAAQTFNVYGTWSSITDYRRLSISVDNTTGNATILANKGSATTGDVGTVSINGVPVGLGKGNVSTNVAIGTSALGANTTGVQNLGFGHNALLNNTTGAYNTAVGNGSLNANIAGSKNIGLGGQSLYYSANASATSNIAIGFNAGSFTSADAANNPFTGNIYIGDTTKSLNTNLSNEIVIGHSAVGLGSNTAVLGNASITTTALRGNVGIGTTAPSSKLHVNGAIIQKPDASATPPANGDLVVEATSNTTLTFKLKGTDGTVRSGTITLA
jgi:hypothetical protein